ncbi:MAG TPA: hypothetical protein VKA78_15450, partial [Pyrinomonadaceae bacterium]|nr:hypothetical protein [Pyrinomonadaceae bacterium]
AKKSELRSYVDQWLQSGNPEASPIESIEFFESEDGRRLVMICEQHEITIETSLSHRWTRIDAELR